MKKRRMCVIMSALLAAAMMTGAPAAATADAATLSQETVVVSTYAGHSLKTATAISLGTSYSGTITSSDQSDIYKFTLSSSGKITIDISSYISTTYCYIYDEDGDKIASDQFSYSSSLGYGSESMSWDLTSGTYYFRVAANKTGDYNFTIQFESANESFAETSGGSNNSFTTASAISLNTTYNGQLAENDAADCYTFTLSKKTNLYFDSTLYIIDDFYYFSTAYIIYDASGNSVWKTSCSPQSSVGYKTMKYTMTLSAGTYYFVVCGSKGSTYNTGNYTFSFSTSPKTLGGVTISSVKAKKKKIKISWEETSDAAYYQVQYRKKGSKKWKTVKAKSTSKTIKKLKSGKKYQVRVRAVNGSTKGSWSSKKTVKVK